MTELLDFSEVRAQLRADATLLLGNGFSIACDPRYSYRALRENLEDDLPKIVLELLSRLATDNIEQVMQILEDARWVEEHLGASTGKAKPATPTRHELDEIHAQACAAMVRAISEDHIRSPREIDKNGDRSSYAAAFLDNYETVFTTNYDLLLYWTLMRSRDHSARNNPSEKGRPSRKTQPGNLRRGNQRRGNQRRGNQRRWRDGFRRQGKESFGDLDPTIDINVYYLHGALHLFLHGESTRKHVGQRNLRLLTIVERTFQQGDLPVFVAGGRPEQKQEAIAGNPYLRQAYEAFSTLSGDLVVYGSSLGSSDQHLLDAMATNPELDRIFLGLYGDPDSAGGLALRSTLADLQWRSAKLHGRPVEVHLFDSRSARVWG